MEEYSGLPGRMKGFFSSPTSWPQIPERCVTTHPAVFAAVAEAFIQHGVYLTYGILPVSKPDKAARKSGLARVAGDLSIEAGNFEGGRAHHVCCRQTEQEFRGLRRLPPGLRE